MWVCPLWAWLWVHTAHTNTSSFSHTPSIPSPGWAEQVVGGVSLPGTTGTEMCSLSTLEDMWTTLKQAWQNIPAHCWQCTMAKLRLHSLHTGRSTTTTHTHTHKHISHTCLYNNVTPTQPLPQYHTPMKRPNPACSQDHPSDSHLTFAPTHPPTHSQTHCAIPSLGLGLALVLDGSLNWEFLLVSLPNL